MAKAFVIAIEGPIGVGKTTLATLVAERLDARLVLEEFEENPFLGDFYRDPERHAFQTQLWFLLSRYRQQQELQQLDLFAPLLVTDYMFKKDRLFATLTLSDKELALYDKVAGLLERDVVSPDMVVYLQSDTDRLMANIKKRNRPYEHGMDREYLEALNQHYNDFFFLYDSSPVLIINSNELDFVKKPTDFEEIIKFIREPVGGTRFFNPAGNE